MDAQYGNKAVSVANALGPSAKAILLDREVAPSEGLSFCHGSEELERLGLWDVEGQLSDLGREVRDRLIMLDRYKENE